MSTPPEYRWLPFIAGAAAIVTMLFGAFWLLETRLLANAARHTVATVHLVFGVGTSLMVLFYSLYFVLDRVEASQAHAARAQEKEERLFTVFDELPMAVFVLDSQGHPTFANRRAVDLLGRGVGPAIDAHRLATRYQAFVAGTDEPYPTDGMPIVRALDGEENATATDMEVVRDGRRIPVEVWANPVRDAEGRVAFAIAAFADVTDQRAAEKEQILRVAREKDLERARDFEALRSRFINMAAHELYTPITPIKLQLEALRRATKSDDPARTQQSLDVIQRNVERLHGVVQQILEVARIDAGAISAKRRRIDMARIVEQALTDFEETIQKRDLRVERRVASGLEFLGDEGRLTNAVFNLLDNVAKHTPTGTRVVVRSYAQNGHVVVEVEDDGPGLDETAARRLFQPFRQAAEETGDQQAQGWGLGLYVTRSVVEQHGGAAWCTTKQDGTGTRAGFRIPAEARSDEQPVPPAKAS